MKQIFKNTIALLNQNLTTLMIFQLIYKLIGIAIFLPIVNWVIQYSMKNAGLNYLTTQNLGLAIQNPITIVSVLVLILLLAFYIYFELVALILLFDYNHKQEKITVMQLFKKTAPKALAVYNVKNILLILFTAVMIPTMYLSLMSGVASNIKIPEFILDTITNEWFPFIMFVSINTIFLFFIIRWSFSLHFMVLGEKKIFFGEAARKSKEMLKDDMLKNIIYMIGFSFLLLALLFLFYLAMIGIVIIGIKIFVSGQQAKDMFWDKYEMIKSFMLVFINIMLSSGVVAVISELFYQSRKESKVIPVRHKRSRKKILGVILSFLLIFVLLDQYVKVNSFDTSYIEHIGFQNKIDITAHRGASNIAPENTMAAIKQAVQLGADFAEIDVQQTKDGVLILCHDTDLKRVAGLDKKVWEVTYEEIKKLEVGSWFSEEFRGEKIPTLEEVLSYANGKIKLNIELKKEKQREDLEEKVVQLIQKYNFQNQCLVSSFGYDILMQVKNLDSKIKTLYNVAFAYGEFYHLDKIDAYSVEASSITQKAVFEIHEKGKQIFAWTVNSKNSMKRLINMGIDNIITDNVTEAKEMLVSQNNRVLQKIVNIVYP